MLWDRLATRYRYFVFRYRPELSPRPGVGVDRGRLQVGMAQRGRHQRDGRTVVDGVAGVGVPQPGTGYHLRRCHRQEQLCPGDVEEQSARSL